MFILRFFFSLDPFNVTVTPGFQSQGTVSGDVAIVWSGMNGRESRWAWWTKFHQSYMLMAQMSYSLLSGFSCLPWPNEMGAEGSSSISTSASLSWALRNLSESSDLNCTLSPETDSVWCKGRGDELEVVLRRLRKNLPCCSGALQEFQTPLHPACHFKAFGDWSHTRKISNLTRLSV